MDEKRRIFGYMPDGTPVEEITLRSRGTRGEVDLTCRIITYGAAVRSLEVSGQAGAPVDVVLGFDTLEEYIAQDKYMGAIVGRYANRISGARFALDGIEYKLAANDGPNSLHGGNVGFDKQVWTVEELSDRKVTLSLVSPDGQEGYPGTMNVQVTYQLLDSVLSIKYEADCDQDTVCNLTNHTYFNLSGHGSGSVEKQHIKLLASRYTPIGPGSIPTGEIAAVGGTPMDLRTEQPIGAHIDAAFDQLTMAGGYDHNWVVDDWDVRLRPIALAWSPDTNIAMTAHTTLPGVQFYTGNYLDDGLRGKGGAVYNRRGGFCLETQFFPNGPNQDGFRSCVLWAGDKFLSRTTYRFFMRKGMNGQQDPPGTEEIPENRQRSVAEC